tara:strand:+ start:94 stop:669 length:576 start_codon:yes stop_codon:yes gene_type:complete
MFEDLVVDKIYNKDESDEIFNFLNEKEIEYHKEYKGMYGRMMKVPRGQASFTLNENIHYNYKVSGGSPPNYIMDDKLKQITMEVNKKLNSNFNTILMNVYKCGDDCISFHKDNEKGWVEKTGFATLSFGAERDFQVRHAETKETKTILHEHGLCLYMKYPMNDTYLHGVPKRKRVIGTRISLTFREIKEGV